jgi:hypothetical protein
MLPEWEVGTPAVLIVSGLHAIPVSTSIRRGDQRVVFALGRRRETLTRLRSEPGAALCVLGQGVAFTAYGRAFVVRDELDCAPVTAVELRVERVQDHLADGRTEMLDGARYDWRNIKDGESESRIRAELARI